MGRPEKPVADVGGPLATFALELRRLRAAAGNPSYRDMARSALFSPSVLSSAASGHRLPTLQVTLAFVSACDGDVAAWERRWRSLAAGSAPVLLPAAPPPALPPGAGGTLLRPPHAQPSGHVPPAQLPVRPKGYDPAARIRRELVRQCRESSLPLVIAGPVGTGKSDLGLRLAHDLAADAPDGQLYADLDTADGDVATGRVMGGFLRSMGESDARYEDPGQQAGLYRSLLARRRMVILLDNARTERQVRPFLAGSLRSRVILVSRRRLLGLRDVRRVSLHPLPRNESVAMLEALVGDRARADPRYADLLADACGDLPLALDVAGRRLASRPHQSLRQIAEDVVEPGLLLQWLRIGDLSVRDRLLAAYRSLSVEARSVLVESGHAVPQYATVVPLHGRPRTWGARRDEAIDELVDAGMFRVDAEGGRYLCPLVRSLVLEGLSVGA